MAENLNPTNSLDFLLTKLENCDGGVCEVSILDLVIKGRSNIIVLDGTLFYGQYIYPKFDWVCGGLKELAEVVREFVLAFENVGAKLVFFFVNGNIDEGRMSLGSEEWVNKHSKFSKYVVEFYKSLSKGKNIQEMKQFRDYYHTPFNALSVVLYVLQHMLNCEVHLVNPGYRSDFTAHYARDNNCLALLSSDKYYLFYKNMPHYLSLKHLNLQTMETKLYDPSVLPKYFGVLEQYVYPALVQRINEENLKDIMDKFNKIIQENQNKTFFYSEIMGYHQGHENVDLDDDDDDDDDDNDTNENDIRGSDDEEMDMYRILRAEYIRYNLGYKLFKKYGPLKKGELIIERARDFCSAGKMNRNIIHVLREQTFYDDCILEDFSELPPSSHIYQQLRKNLYEMLFYEVRQNTVTICVKEWCMISQGCRSAIVTLEPLKSIQNIHPGLLTLWNSDNISDNIVNIKWQLFMHTISPRLDQELQTLPPTLVVPTAVLYFLCQEVPDSKLIKPWEVDVFIVQALMLPKFTHNDISKIVIRKYIPRALKLLAMFVYGCLTMQLLIEGCGNFINKNDVCLLHYFDGKLFHNLYEKAEWRPRDIERQLNDKESLETFNKIKQIVWRK